VTAVFVYAVTLLVAVLVSRLAERTILSTALLFLVGGFVAGGGLLHVVEVTVENRVVARLVELALFTVLFTDGLRTGIGDLASAWRLPGRTLLFGLPLTLAVIAVLAVVVAGLPWLEALLVGAALSATDPVLAAALVGREEVPQRLRHLLNVESGLNDGLALPIVLVLLAVLGGRHSSPASLGLEAVLGLALGAALPWAAARLEASRFFGAAPPYDRLAGFAIGLLLYATATLTQANPFLAAFAGGVTLASAAPAMRAAFHEFGEVLAELLKLAALLVFGALMSWRFLAELSWWDYLFAALVLFAARPAALAIALAGSQLDRREWVAAAWFGPKGFASVVYGLLVLDAGVPDADRIFHLIALVTILSIVAHSSTDVLVARWFERSTPGSGGARPA
jgi:NhaP-type Na+/H+ or K+/H+ antiporter